MKITTAGYRLLNKALDRVGLVLLRNGRDFSCRPTDPRDVSAMCAKLAAVIEEWLSGQTLFPSRQLIDWQSEVERFFEMYLASPFRSERGGSRFNNLLWLYAVTKAYQPSTVVDSGTFEGASAWALREAAPDSATVLSFDIDLSRLTRRSPGVEYIEKDWSTYDFGPIGGGLCYFDDHVDQVKRLIEAKERGFELAIFDDDYPVSSFAPMAGGGFSLPKIEFALDPSLRDRQSLEWVQGGRAYSWPVDAGYLSKGEEAISKTDRLPNTSLVTGIHQTPYRVISVKRDRLP